MTTKGRTTNVVSMEAHIRRNKNWTRAEHELLMQALKILDVRGKAHFPVYFADDEGNQCVAFTAGYHVDATYSVSKVKGRFVVLRYDGACVADAGSLLDALARTLYGGAVDPTWFFLHGLDVIDAAYKERRLNGALQA